MPLCLQVTSTNILMTSPPWPFSLHSLAMLEGQQMDTWEGRMMREAFGGFLKWWYPQSTPKWSSLVGKPIVVGYHHLRKRPFLQKYTPENQHRTLKSPVCKIRLSSKPPFLCSMWFLQGGFTFFWVVWFKSSLYWFMIILEVAPYQWERKLYDL